MLERNDHDAVPEAKAAEPESSVPPGSVAAPANTHTLTDAEREAVARLRNESYCKSDENCTNADMIRLTDEEREAISEVVDCLTASGTTLASPTNTRNTLAALLERLR